MAAFEHSDAIERAVRFLKARLTTLREFSDAPASTDDTYGPSRLDFLRGLCDTALRDCETIESLALNPAGSSIDYSNASLNLRLMQTLADVIATRNDEVKQSLLQMLDTMRQEPDVRRSLRKAAGLPAIVSHTPARVVDLSYGGLRLEWSPADFQAPIEVAFPTLDLSIRAVPRWTKPNEAQGIWWCGAELAPADAGLQQTWRSVVDAFH